MTPIAPETTYVPDSAEVEFARLADAAIAAGDAELRRLLSTGAPQSVLDGVGNILRVLHFAKARAETGTQPRPSYGAGIGLSRAVGELAVSEAFDAACRAVERYYQTRM